MNYSKHFIVLFFAITLSLSFAQDVPRNLALRLARVSDDANLTVGALPADLPLSLALPEEVNVTGSLTEHYEEAAITTLYLTTEADRGLIQEDLTARLQLAGLSNIPQNEPWEWGFVPQNRRFANTYEFCRETLLVVMSFVDTVELTTDIEIRLETTSRERGFDCEVRLEDMAMRDAHTPPVPILNAPAEVEAFDMDFGRTFSGQFSTIALEAALDPKALNEHYAAQLEASDWKRIDGNETASVVWTQWRYEDDMGNPWTGFMQILGDEVFPEQTIAYLFVVQM